MDTKEVSLKPNGSNDCNITATYTDGSTKTIVLPNAIVKMFIDLCFSARII